VRAAIRFGFGLAPALLCLPLGRNAVLVLASAPLLDDPAAAEALSLVDALMRL
jgi:hypothetical protein